MCRRVFLLLVAIECCCASLALDAAERPNVPKDLLFERKPLAADLNAFTEWSEAGKLFVRTSVEGGDEIAVNTERASSLTKTPDVAAIPAVKRWIKTNAAALEWVDKSLKKDQAQFPVYTNESLPRFLLTSKMLSRARLFLADEAAVQGDSLTATNLLLGNFKLAHMLAKADVPMLHYLVASSIQRLTESATVRWAFNSNTPPEMIREMLKRLPPLDDAVETYEQAMRVEFTECIIPDNDLKQMQKIWLERSQSNSLALILIPEELQRALFIIYDPQLMASHPKPLDSEAAIQFNERRFRKLILNARSAWRPEAKEELIAETERTRERYVKDLQPLLKATKDKAVPLSKAAARKAARYYRELADPVGRFLQSTADLLSGTFVKVFQMRTEREATRALLALRVYELENGVPAKSLTDLVDAGLLPTVPLDLFANAPLHYSAEKRKLWSVGQDGVDDGGSGQNGSSMEKDAVWKLPQP